MMPVKALDTLQPIYGLTAFALLIAFLVTGRGGAFAPALGLLIAWVGIEAANSASARRLSPLDGRPGLAELLTRGSLPRARTLHVPDPPSSGSGVGLDRGDERRGSLGAVLRASPRRGRGNVLAAN